MEDNLHPIIDDLLNEIRKRFGDKNGRQGIVEEFVLPEEGYQRLLDKLQDISTISDQKKAIESIIAFSLMVEKKGWIDNALRIRSLCSIFRNVYQDTMTNIILRLMAEDFDTNLEDQSHPFVFINGKTFKPWQRHTVHLPKSATKT